MTVIDYQLHRLRSHQAEVFHIGLCDVCLWILNRTPEIKEES